jgi:methionyl-tRNA formyltransferase
MMGTGTFAEPTFEALLQSDHSVVGLVTRPDHPKGHITASTRQTGKGMKQIALEHGVPVLQPESINTPEGVAQLKVWQGDLLVVAAYGEILSKDVLATTTHGGINVHASLLPKYRGAAPVAWAIYHGERQTGVSIIKMSIHLDAGDVLAQEAIDILPDETAGELEARLAPLGSRLAVQVSGQIAAGTAQGVKQDQSLVTKAPKLKKEHGLIDWSRTAEQVCNQVRAMQPWPTAYTYFRRAVQPPLRIIVYKAQPVTLNVIRIGNPSKPFPGEILVRPGERWYVHVHTGSDQYAEILELQPAGKRRMTATDFLRGHPLQPGDYFGPEST